jgi:hypothetical protein
MGPLTWRAVVGGFLAWATLATAACGDAPNDERSQQSEPFDVLETALAEGIDDEELFRLVDKLAQGDDDQHVLLLLRAAELYEAQDIFVDAVEPQPLRAAAIYERALTLRPTDLRALDGLIESHRRNDEFEALALAAERKAELMSEPGDRDKLRAYAADVRRLAADAPAPPRRADSSRADVRFTPGAPPQRARVQVGFSGDGLYASSRETHTLVLLRSDGEYGPLSLLKPESNIGNRWRFGTAGTKLEPTDPRLEKLVKLPHEGFYRLVHELEFGEKGRWLAGAIVQLGYTREGVPIVFIAQQRQDEQGMTTLFFSDSGVKIARDQLQWLETLAWYTDASPSPPEG